MLRKTQPPESVATPPRCLARAVFLRQARPAAEEFVDRWDPSTIWIEKEYLGQATLEMFSREMPIKTIATGGQKKLHRASTLLHRLERGEVYLPREEFPWRQDFQTELLAWSGHSDDVNDQVDAAAYAAILAERHKDRRLKLTGGGALER